MRGSNPTPVPIGFAAFARAALLVATVVMGPAVLGTVVKATVLMATILIAAITLVALPAPVGAVPVYKLLAGGKAQAAPRWKFGVDLARMWKERDEPLPAHLVPIDAGDPENRLRTLARGRGDFAIVDAETAAEKLPEFPRITVVAVLWPEFLHALSRKPGLRKIGTRIQEEVWVFDNVFYPHTIFTELSQRRNGEEEWLPVKLDAGLIPDALDYADGPLLLVATLAGDPGVTRAMAGENPIRLVSYSQRLLEEMKLRAPYLLTAPLPKGSYPGQPKNLELPALYRILVARKDIPPGPVEKMLSTLYDSDDSMEMFNPLFTRLKPRLNAVFAKLMPFHPATAERFRFNPDVP